MPIECVNLGCDGAMHRMAVTYWCPYCEMEIPYRDEVDGDGVALLYAEVNDEPKELPVKAQKGDSVIIVAVPPERFYQIHGLRGKVRNKNGIS